MSTATEVGPFGIDGHESIGLGYFIEPGRGSHLNRVSHATMKHDHGWPFARVGRTIENDRSPLLLFYLQLDNRIRFCWTRLGSDRIGRGRILSRWLTKCSTVKRPVGISERFERLHWVMVNTR